MVNGAYNPGDNASRRAMIDGMLNRGFQPITNGSSYSSGPSTAEMITNTVFSALMLGANAYVSTQMGGVSQAQAPGASGATMGSLSNLMGSSQKACTAFDSDLKIYNDTQAELKELEDRKSNTSKLDTLKAEYEKFEGGGEVDQAAIQLYQNLKSAVAGKGEITEKATKLKTRISCAENTINTKIPTSNLSDIGQALINTDTMNGPGAVSLISSNAAAYATATIPDGTQSPTFQRDLKQAKTIDDQLTKRQEAIQEKAAAEAEAQALLNGLPTFEGIAKPTDLSGVEAFYSQIEAKISEMDSQEITGANGYKGTLKGHSDAKSKYDTAVADKGSTDDIDAQIKSKKALLDVKKSAVAEHKVALKGAFDDLSKAIAKIDKTISEYNEMKAAKEHYHKERDIRRKDNNFVQNLFARNKTKNEKTTKATYDSENREFKDANSDLKSSYSDVANVKDEKALNGQKQALENQLNQVSLRLMQMPA